MFHKKIKARLLYFFSIHFCQFEIANYSEILQTPCSVPRAEILVGIQLDSDWDYLLQLGI